MDKHLEANEQSEIVLGKILSDLEMVTSFSDFLNIAIIGKTGSGKSSFLNAFRGILNNEDNAAKVSADAKGCNVLIERAKFQHKFIKETLEYTINFFDTTGFQDNNNTNIQHFLDELKIHYKIDEFDAIIFLTNEKLSRQELETAQSNEKKKVMLFFVYNQVDNYYRNQLTVEGIIDDPLKEQVIKYKDKLEEKRNALHNEICDLITEHRVFDSLFSEIKEFTSDNLKSDKYINRLIKESVYFISSKNATYFEDELFSKDGSRLKKEIEEHLVRTKFNNMNINLLEPFSKRTIYLKKKSILENLFDSKKLEIAFASLTSVIPFLDILPTSRINKSYKQEFFEKFGIKELKDRLRTNPSLISDNCEKIQKINKIFDHIDQDNTIKNLDLLFDQSNIRDIDGLIERIKHFINNILPAIGITAANSIDDIAKIAGYSLSVTTNFLRFVSFPIPMTIYLILLKRGVQKILIKYEEYSLLLCEVLHD